MSRDTEISRTLCLGCIDDDSASEVVEQVSLLTALDIRRPILLFVNSPGGDVWVARGIAQALEVNPAPVYIIGIGSVCSAALVLLALGPPGRRFITQASTAMLHHGTLEGLNGARADIIRFLAFDKKHEKTLWAEICSRSNLELSSLLKSIGRGDLWFTGQETVDAGLADGVWTASAARRTYKLIHRKLPKQSRT